MDRHSTFLFLASAVCGEPVDSLCFVSQDLDYEVQSSREKGFHQSYSLKCDLQISTSIGYPVSKNVDISAKRYLVTIDINFHNIVERRRTL